MTVLLTLLCIVGVSYAIQNLSGPFDVFAMLRNLVARIPLVGSFLVSTMSCSFCLGLWTSVGVYFLTGGSLLAIDELVLWAFGGAMFNTLFFKVLDHLDIKLSSKS